MRQALVFIFYYTREPVLRTLCLLLRSKRSLVNNARKPNARFAGAWFSITRKLHSQTRAIALTHLLTQMVCSLKPQ